MRLLNFPELPEKGIRYTRTHIDRLEKAGKFPKRVRPSANRVAWVEDEIDDWLKAKVAERDNAAA
jgi:prophage regulatory protein